MNKTEERATKLIDTPKCLLVGNLPEGAANVDLESDRNLLFVMTELWIMLATIQLPPGSYGQPILASEMTEEQARKLVQKVDLIVATHFKDYENKGVVKKALESFASLLRSHNLQPSTTCVIPKTI